MVMKFLMERYQSVVGAFARVCRSGAGKFGPVLSARKRVVPNVMVTRGLLRLLMTVTAGCLLLPAGVIAGTREVGSPPGFADLPRMERDARCGQVMVWCRIAGKPARMMLDTGATHTVISHQLAHSSTGGMQRLDVSGVEFVGNVAAARPEMVRANLQAGGVDFRAKVMLVMELAEVNALLEKPIDGILGMDVLRHLSFVLDFRNNRFSWGHFRDVGLLEPLVGRADAAGRLLVCVEGGGRKMTMLLDTGCSRTVVRHALWPVRPDDETAPPVADINGRWKAAVVLGQPGRLKLSSGVLSALIEPIVAAEREADGLIGVDALRESVLMHRADALDGAGFYIGSAPVP